MKEKIKHDSCKACHYYWSPNCQLYPIPIRVYDPYNCYCENHRQNEYDKKK